MRKTLLTVMCLVAMMAAGVGLKAQEITITLDPGWNWISYPNAVAMEVDEALTTFAPMEGDMVKGAYGFSVYHQGRWVGGLTHFMPGRGYMYYSTHSEVTSFVFAQPFSSVVATATPTDITAVSAVVGGVVMLSEGSHVYLRGVCWGTESNLDIDGSHTYDGTGIGMFTSTIEGLASGTTYYVRAYAVSDYGLAYGDVMSFTTLSGIPNPEVSTAEVTDITATSATTGGTVVADENLAIIARGVCWSTSSSPTISDSHTNDGTGTGSFVSTLTGLTSNTTYYVRAYATTAQVTTYGEEQSFTTSDGVVVTTLEPMLITAISAMCGGEVTVSDGTYILVKGLCWAAHENPTTNDDFYEEAESGVGSFSLSMTGLNISTTYYVRAYAVTANGTVYGNQKTFTTRDGIPTLTTAEVTNITGITATCGGDITDNGGLNVTTRGVCWSTSPNPTVADPHTTNGSGNGSFSSSITGLSVSTTYYVRAYATTTAGTGYGEEKAFTTRDGIPTLTTAEITNITGESATGGGYISDDGGLEVIDRGVCWSTSPNPTISDNYTTNGIGTGSFTSDITGLSIITTYYVRAYVTNSAGTTYGNEVSFSTRNGIPTLTTAEITNYECEFASCGGTITDDGGLEIIQCGVCWNTITNPTINNYSIIAGDYGGIGSFTCGIWLDEYNTTYYIRAYAMTNVGIGYGNEVIFTTSPAITTIIENVGKGSAICEINSTCFDIMEMMMGNYVGVCWSTNPTPTVNDNYISRSLYDGYDSYQYGYDHQISFSTFHLSDLNPGTTYYVRAYCGSYGYGNEVSFTTLEEQWNDGTLPGLFSVDATQQVYFSQGNLQYHPSTDTWRFHVDQYEMLNYPEEVIHYNGHFELWYWSVYKNGWKDLGLPAWENDSISNGGNTTNTWRELTQFEWDYLFNTRITTSGIRYAKARVNNINGVLLLPDNWISDTYNLNNTNNSEAPFNSNVINGSQLTMLESVGAVFLPAVGSIESVFFPSSFEFEYEDVVVDVGSSGSYRSGVSFNNSTLNLNGSDAVRLVRDVE